MTDQDRQRWDRRYADVPAAQPGLPAVFAPFVAEFPGTGHAVDVACGQGQTSVWLAQRGLDVIGYDISGVAIGRAQELAARCGVSPQFEVVDLDDGLPAGPASNVIVCHKFRDPRLDGALLARLAPGGLLAVSALSGRGGYRVADADLTRAFSELDILASGITDGTAWLLGRR